MRERLLANLAQGDAGDGDDVRREDGADCKRHDGVEGDAAAEVDEREDTGDGEGDANSVQRDVVAGFDLNMKPH